MSTITKSMAPVDYGYLITAETPIEHVGSMIAEHKKELRSYTGKIAFDLTPHAAFLQANLRNGVLDSNSIRNRESLDVNWQVGDIAYCYDELEDVSWASTFEYEDSDEDFFTDDDYVDNGIVEVRINYIDHERLFHKIEVQSPDTGREYNMDSINLAPTREAAEALLIPTEQQMAERKEWLQQRNMEITERQNKMASEQYEKDDVPNMTNKFLLYDLETGHFIDEEFESKSGNNIEHAAIFSKESVLDNIDYAKYMPLKYLQIPLTQDIVSALPFPLTDTDLAKPHSTTYSATKDLKSNCILLTAHDSEPSRSNLYDLGQLDERDAAKLLLNSEHGEESTSTIIIPVSDEQRAKLEQLPAFSRDHELESFAASIEALSEPLTEEEQKLFEPHNTSQEEDSEFSASVDELNQYYEAAIAME